MSDRVKFSIITPSYDQGRYIGRCIASVLEEAKSDEIEVEHIILDNCSCDETIVQLQGYSKSPGNVSLKILVEADAGQTCAINKGFSLATGDIICWLNTDEYYSKGSLEKVARQFRSNLSLDVVFGNCIFVDADNEPVGRRSEKFFNRSMLLFYGCFIPSCSTFIRRNLLSSAGYLNEKYKVCMDFEWYLRLSSFGAKFLLIDSELAFFTWHDSNVSRIYSKRRKLESFEIRSTYSCVKAPAQVRKLLFTGLSAYWKIVRIGSRVIIPFRKFIFCSYSSLIGL